MATGKLRQVTKSRFSDDLRARAKKALEQQRLEKERGVERFPVKPGRKLKERPLKDSSSEKESKSDKKSSDKRTPKSHSLKDMVKAPTKGYLHRSNQKMAKGGSVSKRADGCATKGRTKGRMV